MVCHRFLLFIFWALCTIFITEFSSYAKRFLNVHTDIFLQGTPFFISTITFLTSSLSTLMLNTSKKLYVVITFINY